MKRTKIDFLQFWKLRNSRSRDLLITRTFLMHHRDERWKNERESKKARKGGEGEGEATHSS